MPKLYEPRKRSCPDYVYSEGDAAVDFAADHGLILDEWQADAVRDILAADPESLAWNTFEAALLVPRQNGKGAVLEAIVLYGLFEIGERLIIWTAHEFRTAQEAFRRIRSLVENDEDLMSQVRNIWTGAGNEGIELKNGCRLRFLARSGNSGRGFSCDRLIYDEAYELSEETVAASLPTMSARPNPQLLYTSSAALGKSVVLRQIMRRGRQEPAKRNDEIPEPDPGLTYVEYSADPKASLDDEAEWLRANPGSTGARKMPSVEFIRKERVALSEVAFARERLGILDESAGGNVIDMTIWEQQGDPLSSLLDPVSFAIDVNPDSSWTSIAIAGVRADGHSHIEVVKRERGTGWVVDDIEELVNTWSPASVTLDAIGPAGQLLPAFAERGIHIDVVSMREYGHACALFKSMVEDGRLFHKAQSGLTGALEAARKRDLDRDAGLWAWHRRDSTDITPLVSVTLANFAHARAHGAAKPVDNRVVVFR